MWRSGMTRRPCVACALLRSTVRCAPHLSLKWLPTKGWSQAQKSCMTSHGLFERDFD